MSLDFEGVWMPQVPVHSDVQPESDNDGYKTYKVLAVSDFIGSHKKNMDGYALDLSKTMWAQNNKVNMFNVTLFTDNESDALRKKQGDFFHIVEWTHKAKDMITSKGPNFPNLIKHENNLMD